MRRNKQVFFKKYRTEKMVYRRNKLEKGVILNSVNHCTDNFVKRLAIWGRLRLLDIAALSGTIKREERFNDLCVDVSTEQGATYQ
jgi:hypothetical protein